MKTFLFILTCYGACNNMIYGSIFEGWSNFLKTFGVGGYSLHKIFTCFMCLGTWVGFAITALLAHINKLELTPWGDAGNLFITIFINGLLSGGGVWLIHTLQEFLERGFTNNQ